MSALSGTSNSATFKATRITKVSLWRWHASELKNNKVGG